MAFILLLRSSLMCCCYGPLGLPKRQFVTTNNRCITSQKNEDLDTFNLDA